MYSQEIVDEVNKINIVDYISKQYEMNKKGGLYELSCPFHKHDDTPSLKVYPDTNSWYCFGCGRGTSIIDFVKYQYSCSFT
ncbi:MAG: CHC2 zinc finger domain-containing protein, partial [Candidatus Pacebacteria bacterium]|nr:CHC2 zinc finger domain-containing protein [Candidatus Paceibacterota bacterium]